VLASGGLFWILDAFKIKFLPKKND
jgi:hypothetical protein